VRRVLRGDGLRVASGDAVFSSDVCLETLVVPSLCEILALWLACEVGGFGNASRSSESSVVSSSS